MLKNKEIRQLIKNSKVYSWEVADALKVHENTFYRMLRKPLSIQKKQEILHLIEELSTLKSV